jgi:hypothetical protein
MFVLVMMIRRGQNMYSCSSSSDTLGNLLSHPEFLQGVHQGQGDLSNDGVEGGMTRNGVVIQWAEEYGNAISATC